MDDLHELERARVELESLRSENELYRRILGDFPERWYGKILLRFLRLFVRK